MPKSKLIESFTKIVSKENVVSSEADTAYYRTGFRYGFGHADVVVFPSTLLEQWEVLKVAVKQNCNILLQAAKTGLTGGSTPRGLKYEKPLVIINVSKIKKLKLLNDGKQALAFPGTTLFELTEELKKIDRVPHSVLGSTTTVSYTHLTLPTILLV